MVSESVRVERSGKMLNRDKCAVLCMDIKLSGGKRKGRGLLISYLGYQGRLQRPLGVNESMESL